MDDGGFDSEHNAKISWRHFLHQNSEWSGTLFTKPDKIDHQKQPGLWADGTRAKEATGMRETHEPVYGDDLQPMWSGACDAWTAIMNEKDGDVCIEEARSIQCPTLVAHGELDPMVDLSHAEWFEKNIPDARLQVQLL